MTNSYDVDHGLSQDAPGPLEPVALAASPVSTVEQGDAPYCYVLETRGPWTGEENVLLDVEYNGTDNFSGGRTGGIPLYRRPAPAAGDARAVIQAAVNSIERPRGLTDKQWEFVKAGARLVVRRVNALSAAQRQGDA